MRTQIIALVAALAIAPIAAIAAPAAAFANDGQRPTQPGKAHGAQSLEKKSIEKKTRTPGTPDSAERPREPGRIIFF